MAATISFLTGSAGNLNGSGLGFYGAGFGTSVEVGAWQSSTYITNSAGSVDGGVTNNVKWSHAESGIPSDVGSTTNLQYIPNRLATLNIRFNNDAAVTTQNAVLRIFDRSNINNGASGVTTKVAELIHPDTVTSTLGSGDSQWITPAGSGTTVSLRPQPGQSGLNAMGGNSTTQHDWYVAITASPDSIGAKTLYGLYVELEYL